MTMQTVIISALIGVGGSLIVCAINNYISAKRAETGLYERLGRIEEQIDSLTRKVELHNKMIERTYKLEATEATQNAELERINKRLENLEDDGK